MVEDNFCGDICKYASLFNKCRLVSSKMAAAQPDDKHLQCHSERNLETGERVGPRQVWNHPSNSILPRPIPLTLFIPHPRGKSARLGPRGSLSQPRERRRARRRRGGGAKDRDVSIDPVGGAPRCVHPLATPAALVVGCSRGRPTSLSRPRARRHHAYTAAQSVTLRNPP